MNSSPPRTSSFSLPSTPLTSTLAHSANLATLTPPPRARVSPGGTCHPLQSPPPVATRVPLSSLPTNLYLSISTITPFLNDALSTLLTLATPPNSGVPVASVKSRPHLFLANYFEQVCDPKINHTVGKNFSFVAATLHNRATFLHHFLAGTTALRASHNGNSSAITPDDFHHLVLFLCPDFIRPLIHTTAWFTNGGKPVASTTATEVGTLTRSFVVYFYHLEFFLLLLTFFSAAYDGASGR